MKDIRIIGAGKSATVLIHHLQEICIQKQWRLTVADADEKMVRAKLMVHENIHAAGLIANDDAARSAFIAPADLVISMLPPKWHILVAKDCLQMGKHLLTASYVDNDMKSMEKEIKERRLIFLCEMGLDPGIDHMSAMQLIHRIQASGGKITHFYSHCGGLIAPESDDNPWHYKISWNPRNIVTAGSSGAVFKENNRIIERTYPDLFNNAPTIQCKAVPPLEWYPNRDSLSYIPVYGLEDASTFIRTTLRFRHFCSGWHTLASLALTDTSDVALVKTCSTYHEWITKKIASADAGSKQLSEYLIKHVPDNIREITTKQMEYLALDRNEALPNEMNCSADILQHILEGKLALGPEDKDMIVMMHEIHYKTHEGEDRDLKASLVVKGDDSMHTAMAKTVGLPLAIAADLILSGKIQTPGLQIPIAPEIYEPVLTALEAQGICFEEE